VKRAARLVYKKDVSNGRGGCIVISLLMGGRRRVPERVSPLLQPRCIFSTKIRLWRVCGKAAAIKVKV
jgi:hypothetical protein